MDPRYKYKSISINVFSIIILTHELLVDMIKL